MLISQNSEQKTMSLPSVWEEEKESVEKKDKDFKVLEQIFTGSKTKIYLQCHPEDIGAQARSKGHSQLHLLY